jgi:hypothetical protein
MMVQVQVQGKVQVKVQADDDAQMNARYYHADETARGHEGCTGFHHHLLRMKTFVGVFETSHRHDEDRMGEWSRCEFGYQHRYGFVATDIQE